MAGKASIHPHLPNIRGLQADRDEASRSFAGMDEAARLDRASVIINADDWGRDADITDRTFSCLRNEVVSSVSAMMFMKDSERGAELAQQAGVDAGLHLNFTTPFTAGQCSSRLKDHQRRIAGFLGAHRFAPLIYNPALSGSFGYVTAAHLEEFERLYGRRANRIDGHHHRHLCANALHGDLLPPGIIVRRNFTFRPCEKGFINRAYRRRQDHWLAGRYRVADFFFDLKPLDESGRLERIFALANGHNVEVEAHPAHDDEFRFLMDGELMRRLGVVTVAHGYRLRAADERTDVERMR